MDISFTYYIVVFAVTHQSFTAGVSKNISDAIFTNYDTGLRPVCPDLNIDRVNSTLGISVRQLIDLDEPNQIISLNLWIRMTWNDCLLQWTPSDYSGISQITVPYKRLWVPDLTLYDSMSTSLSGIDEYRPTVYSSGSVYYNFPTLLDVLCQIDVTSFPFDTQICQLMFGSWSYHGFDLDLSLASSPVFLSALKDNVEWTISKVVSERHVVYYPCCPEPYPDVTFYFHLKRKPAFYVTNILIPSLMITILGILGFLMPVESGEKVSLEITVMLAMSVFQLLVADKLPPSADATPWIAIFFNFSLGLCGVTTVIQVFVINIFYRDDKEIPDWMMKYFIEPACFFTRVDLPLETNEGRLCCFKRKKPDNVIDVQEMDLKVGKEYVSNGEIWKAFSNAIDRIGLMLFSVCLFIGCIVIFAKISS